MDIADTTISDSTHSLGRLTAPQRTRYVTILATGIPIATDILGRPTAPQRSLYRATLTATAAVGIGVLGLLTTLWRHTDPQRTIFFTPRLYAIVQPGTLIWPAIVDVWFVFSYFFSMGALRFGQALSR